MGDFQRHRFDTLHDVFLRDEQGGVLSRVTIVASVTLSESWAHLEGNGRVAMQRAGPQSRRIVETVSGFTVTAYGANTELPASPEVQVLVDELRAHDGLQVGGAVVGFQSPAFEQAVRDRLAGVKGTLTFRSAGR